MEQWSNHICAWTHNVPVEIAAREQVFGIANLPFTKHVAVMPDCHVGMGATVGTVFASENVLIPAAVGVDLGCGMIARKLDVRAEHLPDNLSEMRSAIEAFVPHGRTNDGQEGDRGAWTNAPYEILDAAKGLFTSKPYLRILDSHPRAEHGRALNQLGTLGTGNHFIEVCLDEAGQVWVMLHSGSRGPGNRIAQTFINLAKRDMERWHIQIPNKDLAYIPQGSEHFGAYIGAVHWAQWYAEVNRELMMRRTLAAVAETLRRTPGALLGSNPTAVNCHHNYVSRERHFGKDLWVTRKGAVSAARGELGIIPGSMGAKSYITSGKGHPASLHSCSHGAGRLGSRRWARETFTVDDHAKATAGVECRKDESVLDETPAAYKNIDDVMQAQSDLVDIEATLKQVVCVKG